MTHPERLVEYLEHMVTAIDRMARYVGDLNDPADLRSNEQAQDAVVRNIEIIGEAAARVQRADAGFAAQHPEIPWTEMRDMRNKMIHQYFEVDWNVVWATIKFDLPPLRAKVLTLIEGRT